MNIFIFKSLYHSFTCKTSPPNNCGRKHKALTLCLEGREVKENRIINWTKNIYSHEGKVIGKEASVKSKPPFK